MAATVLLPGASPSLVNKMKAEVPLLLEYDESRIRLTAGVYNNSSYLCQVALDSSVLFINIAHHFCALCSSCLLYLLCR